MGDPVLLLVGGIALLGISYFQRWRRKSRRRAVEALAGELDFTFSTVDSYGLDELPFSLFRQGGVGKARLVISGTHNGLPLQIFDYEHRIQGHSNDSELYTCAVLTIAAGFPWLQLVHESAVTRLADQLAHSDVDLEYDDFNRRFVVNCADRTFAFCMLDGRMMEWLLGTGDFGRLEIIGPWVLLANAPVEPRRWKELGEWLDEFRSHIPPVVYSSYPPR